MTGDRTPDDFEREVGDAFRERLSALESIVPSASTGPRSRQVLARPARGRLRAGRSGRLLGAWIAVIALVVVSGTLVGLGRWASQGATSTQTAAAGTPSPFASSTATGTASPPPSAIATPVTGWAGLSATGARISAGDRTLIFSWPGGLLARGPDSAALEYSADDRSWSKVGNAPAFDYRHDLMDGLAWTGDQIVATGWRGSAPVVWTSADGRNWSVVDTGGTFAPSGKLVGLAANPSGVVGATEDGQVWRSADGRAWTSLRLPADQRVRQVVATSGRFVVAAANGGNGGAIPNQGVTLWSSSDGLGWRAAVPTRGQWTSVQLYVVDDSFVAYEWGAAPSSSVIGAGALAAWRSADGFDWQSMRVPPAGYELEGSNGSIIVAEQLVGLLMSDDQPLLQSVDGEHWTPLPIAGADSLVVVGAVVPDGIFVHLGLPGDPYEFFEATPASP